VRPIGNGDLFRKLAARLFLRPKSTKIALSHFFLNTYPNYKQFGVAVPSGVEKMYTAVTLATGEAPHPDTSPDDLDLSEDVQCTLHSDISNAFNEIERQILFDTLAGVASRDYPGTSIHKGDPLTIPPLEIANAFITSLYKSLASFKHYANDGSTYDVQSSAGLHQGCVFGSYGFAAATFHPIGSALSFDTTVLGTSLADNTCLTGPLKNVWAMYDRLRIVFEGLGLRLNPRECVLWVPQWSHLTAPPRAFFDVQSRFPSSTLRYTPQGFPLLGLPLGTTAYAQEFLTSITTKIASTLDPVSRLHDGRIYLMMMRSCVNLRPLFYARNLPNYLTNPFTFACDEAFMGAIASYLCFPMDWADNPVYLRAVAQMRNTIKEGGFGLTSAQSITHSSFYAGFASGLANIGSSTLHAYVNRDFLSVNNPGSSSHSFLKGFHDSREMLVSCGATKAENVNNLTPKDAVILPSAADLLPADPDPDHIPTIPPQRVLSALIKSNHPDFASSKALYGATDYDISRVKHLSHTKTLANPKKTTGRAAPSILAPILRGETAELGTSANSWIAVVPGSKSHDAFPRNQFIVFVYHLLGLPQPVLDHAPLICSCSTPFDPKGHHKLTCPGWVRNSSTRGHDLIVNSVVDLSKSCGVPCSANRRTVPSHTHTNHRGDLIFAIKATSRFSDIIGDVTMCHPALGNPSDPSHIGTWQGDALTQRFSAKRSKHQKAYENQDLLFLPLVISTFGVLHPDFLRLLWILADKASSATDVGEVRTGSIYQTPRQLIFHKLHARVSIAAAKATVMRALGISGTVYYVPPTVSYEPSDPSLLLPTSVTGIPIGPFLSSGS
jgi:hypothetical protein